MLAVEPFPVDREDVEYKYGVLDKISYIFLYHVICRRRSVEGLWDPS